MMNFPESSLLTFSLSYLENVLFISSWEICPVFAGLTEIMALLIFPHLTPSQYTDSEQGGVFTFCVLSP